MTVTVTVTVPLPNPPPPDRERRSAALMVTMSTHNVKRRDQRKQREREGRFLRFSMSRLILALTIIAPISSIAHDTTSLILMLVR